MDLYTTPQDDTYLLNWRQWYTIPQDENKSFLVVVMSTREAQYWTVTYTILVGYIFSALISLAADITIPFFPLRNHGTRHAMLASFRNDRNPITLFQRNLMWLFKGLYRVKKNGEHVRDWKTIKGSLFFIAFAVFFFATQNISQFLLGGRELKRFQRAPANPAKLFYPYTPPTDPNFERIFDALRRIKAAGVYQSIGRSEIARVALSKRIMTDYREWDRGTSTKFEYFYSYGMSGFEMGLRDAPNLMYNVSGHCISDYSISSLYVEGVRDIYPFPGATDPAGASAVDSLAEERQAPFLNIDHNQFRDFSVEPIFYNIVPHTAGRLAHTENKVDPWYATEVRTDTNGTLFEANPYRVRRFRPPVQCHQNDTFTLGKHTVISPSDLYTLPGLKLSEFLQGVFVAELSPPIVTLISAVAESATLDSAVHFSMNSDDKFNAEKASTENDLKRLTYLAFVYSREIVRNTVLLYGGLDLSGDLAGLENLAVNPATNRIEKEYADFFIDTPNAAALDVYLMLIVPAICLLLVGISHVYSRVYSRMGRINTEGGNSSRRSKLALRKMAFNGVHLYRMLDEAVTNRRRWGGRLSETPFVRDLSEETPSSPILCTKDARLCREAPAIVNEKVTTGALTDPNPEGHLSKGLESGNNLAIAEVKASTLVQVPKKNDFSVQEEERGSRGSQASSSDSTFIAKHDGWEATEFQVASHEFSAFVKPRAVLPTVRLTEPDAIVHKHDLIMSPAALLQKLVFPFLKGDVEGCHDWLDLALTTENPSFVYQTRPDPSVLKQNGGFWNGIKRIFGFEEKSENLHGVEERRDIYWNRVRKD
ncbi:hypothetical protein BJ508DRAFT_157925 [Ascobolus immersus RN42]|uniref:Uncharacterized protein n=1 Tax=Ascobolus immersus RN42 TaxID=1160509 RepID=A0A3N4IIG8_ASCIM|nr:hypothetical protein BJ508DRAFT_157925 [Ascobolus immersus RN42]